MWNYEKWTPLDYYPDECCRFCGKTLEELVDVHGDMVIEMHGEDLTEGLVCGMCVLAAERENRVKPVPGDGWSKMYCEPSRFKNKVIPLV